MCGIVGIVGEGKVAPKLLGALQRLEYRGYDSAGIATLVNGHIDRRRAEGKLAKLADRLERVPLDGDIGIGHTRWATHGIPSENNAHPHATDRVALVHNGIIENFRELKEELLRRGSNFASETDTEVVAHMITSYLYEGLDPVRATAETLKRLEGAFALAIIFAGEHDLMIGARRGTPLVLGYGDGEMYLGSDALALAPLTRRICYLDEGDWAVIRRAGAEVHDVKGARVERPVRETASSLAEISKGNHRHFMAKEIHEQPTAVGDTLHSYVHPSTRRVELPELPFDFADLPKLSLVACGTSYYAAQVAQYWFEQVARLPADVDIGSEFRYRNRPLPDGGAALCISQSGETLDTLEALRLARRAGQKIVSIVNVTESTMARESDMVLATHAGPEIGVASTKAFTTQLAILAALAIVAARQRGSISAEAETALTQALTEVPAKITQALGASDELERIAQEIMHARDVLYLGRGTSYPIALEGALKLKEISYIHAEGYAAGEMKHGPIALIDENVPVIVVAPSDGLIEKTAANVEEVAARNGRVVLLSDAAGIARAGAKAWASIELPEVHPMMAPILYAVPVQLLAYHVAALKGTDVDQPRNLAKSVTVE